MKNRNPMIVVNAIFVAMNSLSVIVIPTNPVSATFNIAGILLGVVCAVAYLVADFLAVSKAHAENIEEALREAA